jgi:HD-GYP domain-containing protein (c-di-GMP phosphodiesterase class II)
VLSRTSCEVAETTARRIGLPDGVQTAVRHMTEWYDGRGGFLGSKRDEIPLAARIVSAAFTASIFDLLAGPEAATAAVRARAGRIVDPEVAEALVRDGGAILAELDAVDLLRSLADEEPSPTMQVPEAAIDDISVAFGEAVDLKTPFTHGSARRAFELAGAAGSALGIDEASVRRAAALRDIGNAALPNAVVEKPGPLTELEWETVRLHPYHSERVLSRSPALAAVAAIAGMHHERPDGRGYHRGVGGAALPAEARVVAAADALTAMLQPRPYRPAMGLEEACRELEQDGRSGRFDADAVRAVVAAAHGVADRIRPAAPAGLTPRQVDVLRLVAEGLSNREIAQRLVVSARTAEHHVQDVYLKIGVSSRAAAALFAVEHGLLQPRP